MSNDYKCLTEFYPTPPELIAKMLYGVDFSKVDYVLEPSAGKGDIALFYSLAYKYCTDRYYKRDVDSACNLSREDVSRLIIEKYVISKFNEQNREGWEHFYSQYKNIECIESAPVLRDVLEGRDLRVVDTDFLKFDGDKMYDLIIMNPPFSNGDEHLLQAIKIGLKGGSQIVCLLNAETIRNPYSNSRKELLKQLEKYGATYEYIENAFTDAERSTDVEVVIVRLTLPNPFSGHSVLLDELKEQEIKLDLDSAPQALVTDDKMQQAVLMYKQEVAAGKRLIEEYLALKPYLTTCFEKENTPEYEKGATLRLVNGDDKRGELDFNKYVYSVRYKYWYELLHSASFMGNLTSNLRNDYYNQIKEFAHKDFSLSNIYAVKIDILKNTARGIEEKILTTFEKLSYEHSMGCDKNVHYYNGWKTNKAYKINTKVVVPYMDTWDTIWNKYRYGYELCEFLTDLEKVLDFLDGGETEVIRNIPHWLQHYENTQQTKGLHFKYFDVNVYKKGTIHITFTNEEVLKKLNIFGSMKKGWLPPSYAKASYNEMDEESKAIIDEFQGKDDYEKVFAEKDRYLFSANTVLMLNS